MSRKPPLGWRGNYVTAPSLIEAQQGKAYSQIIFLGPGRAQILAEDRDFAQWGWSASLSIAPDEHLSFRMKCESVVVFRMEGKGRIVYQRVRGEEGKYISVQEGNKSTAERLLGANARLDALVPKAFRDCEDKFIVFHPNVREGGEVTLLSEDQALEFFSQDSEAYRPVVKRLTEPKGRLTPWESSPGIYASLSNAYLAMPQTHRFYQTRIWTGERKPEGGFVLKGIVAPKPGPAIAIGKLGKDDFIYNQVERGEWILLKPVSAHLFQREFDGTERDLGAATLSSDGLMTLELATIPERLSVEVSYEREDGPGEFVQSFQVGVDGKRGDTETLEML